MINSRRMRWAGCVLCVEEIRNACNSLIEKPRPRWEENARVVLKEMLCQELSGPHLVQDMGQ